MGTFEVTTTSVQIAAANTGASSQGYDVRVRAWNGAWSAWSPTTRVNVPPATAPDAPSAPTVTATAGSTTSLDVSWTAPADDGGRDIDDYDLEYRVKTPQGTTQTHDPSGTATSTSIGSLQPGTVYQVRVRAENDEGDGSYSPWGEGSTTAAANNAPAFTDGATTTRSVDENSASGESVGAPVAASDADNDNLTYTMGGTDASAFTIVSTTGLLETTTGVTYNFEAKSSYSVTVTVTDGNSGTDSIDVTINLNDVDEPPGDPGPPTLSSATMNSLTVQWTASTNTGPAVTYDVEYREDTSGSWSDGPQNVSGLSATITSLQAGTAYQVRVQAGNDEGRSQWVQSASTLSTAAAANNAPAFTGAPYSFTLAENADGSTTAVAVGTVSATDPDSDSLSYSITAGNGAGRFAIVPSTGAITYVGTGENHETTANPASAFTLTVRASDGTDHADATVVVAVTDVTETPGDPGAPTLSSATETSLAVQWTASINTGPAVTYDVEYCDAGGTCSGDSDFTDGPQDVTGTSATIGSLQAGTGYQVRVQADNGEGTSAWVQSAGTLSTAAPASTAPDAPATPTFSNITSSGFTVEWVAPDDNGSPITSYDVRYRTAGGSYTRLRNRAASARSEAVTGLNPSTTYNVEVKAFNAHSTGSDPWSPAGQVTTAAARSIAWAGSFTEAGDNDGSVTGSVTATLTGDTFVTAQTLTQAITVSNLPGGLTVARTLDSARTVVTFTLTGRAENHANADDVSDLSFEFGDNAFTGGGAASVTNATSPDIAVDFSDPNSPPAFGQAGYAFNLAENADGSGTAVAVGTVRTTDADGDAVSYSITAGNGAGKFAIVPSTGAITYGGSGENFEAIADPANAFRLTVRADDSNGGTTDAAVVVTVTDVDEPPDAPAAPTFSEQRPTRVTVSWTPPANAGRPDITGYTLRYRTGGGGWTERVLQGDPPAPRLRIEGLAVSTAYEVQVKARNDEGESAWSTAASVTTPAAEMPDAPPAPSARPPSGSRTSLEVSWRAPYDAGSAIERYEVRYRRAGTDSWTTRNSPGTGTSTTLPGLDERARYEVQVRAVNNEGEGGWSSSRFATVGEDRPDPPGMPQVTHKTLVSATVAWAAPAFGGNLPITSYEIRYTPPSRGLHGRGSTAQRHSLIRHRVPAHRRGRASHDTTLIHLEPDRTYQVWVRAVNAAGASEWTGPQRVMTAAHPAAPQPAFGAATPTSLEVTWPAPYDAGSRILEYKLHWRPWREGGRGGTYNIAPVDAGGISSRSVTIGGLSPASRYQVTMRARNANGWGPWSGLVTGSTVAEGTAAEPPPTSPIAGFTLLDGEDGTEIGPIVDGQALAAGLGAVDVRAELAQGASVGSVHFELSGAAARSHTENFAPHEVYGDGAGEVLDAGSYTLTATPYTEANLGGAALPAFTVSFTVAEPATSESRVPPQVTGLPSVSEPSSGGTYAAGERIEARVAFSTPVTVDASGGTSVLGLALGGVRRDAAYVSGSGTETLVFALTVSANDAGASQAKAVANGIRLGGATVRAADGTDAALAFGTAPGIAGAPEIANAPGGDGRWGPGETVEVTLAFAEPVTVTGAPDIEVLMLTPGVELVSRRAAYVRGSGTDRLVFAHRFAGGDPETDAATVVPDSLALAGGTVRSTGGLDAVLAHHGAALTGVPDAPPALSVADASVQEGGTLAFRVTLGRAVAWPVTVRHATSDGTAEAGTDYEAVSGTLTFAPGETERTVSVSALADGAQESAETMALTLSDPSGATLARAAATGTVEDAAAGNAAAFTAQFLGVPPEHDGESVFTFELRFSEEPPELSVATVRDSLLAVTGGAVKRTPRVTRGSNLAFRIHVEPAGLGDVTVAFRTPPPCGLPHAVCTSDGRALAGVATATIPGPASLSVADAEAQEGEGAVLEFAVTLSRARHEATSVSYATSDGTATAGADYAAASGTLTFAAGETERTVSVALLDDAHDDDGETLGLTLSDPRPAATVRLADATATGTVRNSDPLPRAWTARFGRAVAEGHVKVVRGRMEAARTPGLSGRIAGHALPGNGGGASRAARPDGTAAAGTPSVGELPEEERRALLSFRRFLHGDGEDGGDADGSVPDGGEALAGTSFLLTAEPDGGGSLALWGRGARSAFEGTADGGTPVDGETSSVMIGADWRRGDALFGLLLSRSRSEGGYGGASSGTVEADLAALVPWAGRDLGGGRSGWAALGVGTGGMTLTPEGGDAVDADLDWRMAAAGVEAISGTRGSCTARAPAGTPTRSGRGRGRMPRRASRRASARRRGSGSGWRRPGSGRWLRELRCPRAWRRRCAMTGATRRRGSAWRSAAGSRGATRRGACRCRSTRGRWRCTRTGTSRIGASA